MFDPSVKDKFIQMPIEEKRKLYKCGEKFVTIQGISKFKDHIKTLGQPLQNVYPNSSLHVSKLSVEETELFGDKISLWRGDITGLEIDAIVNAANETLLGGGGVDGAIHSAAGKLLLKECKSLNGCKTGQAKITGGYHLPAKYVIHTVGPIGENSNMLKSCYKSCFDIMKSNNLLTISFPCVSTGIYGYPNEPAARIAIEAAFGFLRSEYGKTVNRIIFTLFRENDVKIYERLMRMYFDSLN